MTLQSGQQLSYYRIVEKIGEGGEDLASSLGLMFFLACVTFQPAFAAFHSPRVDPEYVLSQPRPGEPWRVTCPKSVTLLHRDRATDQWLEINRLSLLHGMTDLMPGILVDRCVDATIYEVEQVQVSSPILSSGGLTGPKTRQMAPFTFDGVYMGSRLASQDLTVHVLLRPFSGQGSSMELAHRVITMDASLPQISAIGQGGRLEAGAGATGIPFDVLDLQVVVRNADGEYVLDKGLRDFRVKAGGREALIEEEIVLDEKTGLPLRDPNSGQFLKHMPFSSPGQPASERPALRFLFLLDIGSWLTERKTPDEEGPFNPGPVFAEGYELFIDEALLLGVRSISQHIHAERDAYPAVELVLARYGTSVELYTQLIQLRDGLSAEQSADLRKFFLQPPQENWRIGETNLQLALNSMRAFWHFHDGKRGAIAITSVRARVLRQYKSLTFPPSLFEDEEQTRSRYETVLEAIRNGFPLAAVLNLEHIRRRSPVLYALGIPRNETDYTSISKETILHGGFTVAIREPGQKSRRMLGVPEPINLAAGLLRIIRDLDKAYLFRVTVRNPEQVRQTLRVQASVPGSGFSVRMQEQYIASADRCSLMPAYLSTTLDTAIRLAAAASARDCWDRNDVIHALEARLFGPEPEPVSEIKEVLLRSYGEILFRRLQTGRKPRKQALRQILELDINQLGPALTHRYFAHVESWKRLAVIVGRESVSR